MRIVRRTSQFKKDAKRVQKQGKSLDVMKEVLRQLINDETLSDKYRDHNLIGNYMGARECHLQPDWLLIYELTEDELILVRTGSHSELFR
jgi:mRNA interferase YafQ